MNKLSFKVCLRKINKVFNSCSSNEHLDIAKTYCLTLIEKNKTDELLNGWDNLSHFIKDYTIDFNKGDI